MSNKILVPTLGESITEATVAKWLKTKGDKVTSDEPIVELETDKVNVEVPSPSNGVLESIAAQEGQTVNVGSLLGVVGANSAGAEKSQLSPQREYNPPKKQTVETDKKIKQKKQHADEPLILNEVENKQETIIRKEKIDNDPLILTEEIKKSPSPFREKKVAPSARKIAEEANINLNQVKGSGKNGLILKGDILALMGEKPEPSERRLAHGPEERIKMTRLRMTIAKRLKEAQENAAMLTTFNEVDMSNIIEMRKNNQEDFQNRFGIKLGFMSFFVKASVLALKSFPPINAEIEGDEIVYKNYYNISFAVGTEKGLVVPVLKNADEKSFAEIEKNIKEMSDKAKKGNLTIEDLQGGTFTISNGGVYGSMLSTPILNPPQSGVLGMHNIIERPIVINGEIKIRPIMYLALSYDHRIIDGKDSVSFLKTLKDNLEDPRKLFLDL
jgi:2-oxoglutarate dehydrogenase E2 component (dihydrolipoamide succinyltransferase)